MRRRRLLVAGAASVAVVAGSAVAIRNSDGIRSTSDGDAADPSGARPTAEVTVRDLEERTNLSGTLGYGDPQPVFIAGEGTVTALPEVGTIVDRGQTLIEVDGQPVPLLFGDRPFWRPLQPYVGDGPAAEPLSDGPDIEQLEANLVALGFASKAELTVDQHWTGVTTEVVKRWEESLGQDKDGVVTPADAVVLPEAVRVAGHSVTVGQPAVEQVLEVTGTSRHVAIDLPTARQGLVEVGQAVEVGLSDGTVVDGTVTFVSNVATTGGSGSEGESPEGDGAAGGSPTIEVVVTLDEPDAEGEARDGSDDPGASFDEAPVSVQVATLAAEDVLAVPVDALLALAEGGYAVERVANDGSTQIVGVETGAFGDGWVEIAATSGDGELAAGDDVVVPS